MRTTLAIVYVTQTTEAIGNPLSFASYQLHIRTRVGTK